MHGSAIQRKLMAKLWIMVQLRKMAHDTPAFQSDAITKPRLRDREGTNDGFSNPTSPTDQTDVSHLFLNKQPIWMKTSYNYS